MKYKELPSEKIVHKLLATAFESPSANLKVYNWCNKVLGHIRFLESERVKLVQKYGKENEDGNYSVPKEKYKEFFEEFREVLEMDIEDKIPEIPVKPDWFDDEKCRYPINKDLWLSPEDIKRLFEK